MTGWIPAACSQWMCFFSSRRRHTRLQGDWSSDVCSSDLPDSADVQDEPDALKSPPKLRGTRKGGLRLEDRRTKQVPLPLNGATFRRQLSGPARSEERRVGKECRSRWSPYH